MIAKILTVAVVAVLGLSAPALPAEETVFDGAFWRACSHDVKRFYIQGALSGVMLGQDRVIRRGQPGPSAAPLPPECRRPLVRLVNALEREIERRDPEQLIEALDTFYDVPANRPLGVRWALIAVFGEDDGAAEGDRRQP